jgi:hypothetical protein
MGNSELSVKKFITENSTKLQKLILEGEIHWRMSGETLGGQWHQFATLVEKNDTKHETLINVW